MISSDIGRSCNRFVNFTECYTSVQFDYIKNFAQLE